MRTRIPLGALLAGGAGLLALAASYGLDFAGFAVVVTVVALLGLLAAIVLYDDWAPDEVG